VEHSISVDQTPNQLLCLWVDVIKDFPKITLGWADKAKRPEFFLTLPHVP
jgi:hypothetical protein